MAARRPVLAEKPELAPNIPELRPEHKANLKPDAKADLKAEIKAPPKISGPEQPSTRGPNRDSAISTASGTSTKSKRKTHVGPWQLGRTLGKGATGRVRLAKHAGTGQVAAIKIVSKKSAAMVQSASMAQMDPETALSTAPGFRMMPFSIEREVVIMKLISHPHVINLYDVWENRGEL